VVLYIKCTFDDFGLLLETDPMSHRNIVVDVAPFSYASHLECMMQLQFHNVIQIDDTTVFTVHEVHTKLSLLANSLPESFKMILSPYNPYATDQHSPLPKVALDQLQVIHHVLHGWDLPDPIMIIAKGNGSTMKKCAHHTRRTCLKGPDKDKWMEAEFDMLDKNNSYGMYGSPTKQHNVPSTAKIVRPIWNYIQKGNGVYKARKCMDGKQLVRMGIKFPNMYATCMEKHFLRLFMALAAYLGHIIEDGDVVNAYAHAAAEGTQIYIVVDPVYKSWHDARYGTQIEEGDCIPLHKGMQGHPQAGHWCYKHFNTDCAAPLHLIPSFTEPMMYRRDEAVTKGPTCALCQVDDILVSVAHVSNRTAVLDGIADTVTFKTSPQPTTIFYTTDIEQTSQYIRFYAKAYIQYCLLNLGWLADGKDMALMVSFPPFTVKEMSLSSGPLDPAALQLIMDKFGFPYRTMTGLLIFAVQIWRLTSHPPLPFSTSLTIDRRKSIFAQRKQSCVTYVGLLNVASSIGGPAKTNYPTSRKEVSHHSALNDPLTHSSLPPIPSWNPPAVRMLHTADFWYSGILVLSLVLSLCWAEPLSSLAPAFKAPPPYRSPNLRSSQDAMRERSSNMSDNSSQTFAFHSPCQPPPEKKTRAPSARPPTTDPVVEHDTWTFKTSLHKNGPSVEFWSFSKSTAQQTQPMPCRKSFTGSSLPEISIVCRVTMHRHTPLILLSVPTQTITPSPVDCFPSSYTP
jgi:hypothetical protein